ncbi:MAG: IscS subfamily cysteine desulfurase [Planctomycetes bacterium]|nr:IscS subfamily cysteine desulfurase [Planctomycetota bacterium]
MQLDNHRPIYFDNHATTPLDPRALEAMMPYLKEEFGNAASRSHRFGWTAEEAVENARNQIARLIGAPVRKNDRGKEYTQEIIFTSGATESDNIAILGAAEFYKDKGNHIITVKTEHKAVLDPCKYLASKDYDVSYLRVGTDGLISLDELRKTITDKTILVTIMWANNEIGVLQPIREIGAICRERGVIFHTDAAQAAGKVKIDVETDNIDVLSLSGHKMYGPKGVGALYVRRKNPRVRLSPIIHGGGHERGYRSGTLNVPAIVGFGAAAEIAMNELEEESTRLKELRDYFWSEISTRLEYVELNGSLEHRLPNNLNASFAYVEGEALMMKMKDLAVSSGSACTSASLEPSYVLKELGVREELAHSSIRFGFGRFNTREEVEYAVGVVINAVEALRQMSPLYDMAKEGIDLSTVNWAGGH